MQVLCATSDSLHTAHLGYLPAGLVFCTRLISLLLFVLWFASYSDPSKLDMIPNFILYDHYYNCGKNS